MRDFADEVPLSSEQKIRNRRHLAQVLDDLRNHRAPADEPEQQQLAEEDDSGPGF